MLAQGPGFDHRHGHRYTYIAIDPATGRETLLNETPRREERWPDWSPDGKFISYAFRGGTPGAGVALLRPATRAAKVGYARLSSLPVAMYREQGE